MPPHFLLPTTFNTLFPNPQLGFIASLYINTTIPHTVKRVDKVVRHPHLVTQDQFTQVSKKVSNIPEEDFTKNIELFWQPFTNVELLRQSWKVSKLTPPGREPSPSDLHSNALPLCHILFSCKSFSSSETDKSGVGSNFHIKISLWNLSNENSNKIRQKRNFNQIP